MRFCKVLQQALLSVYKAVQGVMSAGFGASLGWLQVVFGAFSLPTHRNSAFAAEAAAEAGIKRDRPNSSGCTA